VATRCRRPRIGALIVAVHAPNCQLCYAGGTGFTERMLADLAKQLAPLERETSALNYELPRDQTRDAHWVTPALVGEVTCAEWTSDRWIFGLDGAGLVISLIVETGEKCIC
jgi:bifunctional non-homologous end joining protein LigD